VNASGLPPNDLEKELEDNFDGAMKSLSKYIRKYHSNLVREFKNMDKDMSGTLSVVELKQVTVHILCSIALLQ